MDERRLRRELVHLPVAINVLQGIADGVYQKNEILRLEVQLRSEVAGTPFYIISRALILANSKGLINTDKIREEPTKPLNDKDKDFIEGLHQGWNNSQIIENLGWRLEEVYKYRRRVFRALEVKSDYQVVIWEARRRKRERALKDV